MPVLETFDYPATFFIYPLVIGGDRFMDWQEVRTVVNYGHTIGSHSMTHPVLTRIDDATLRRELEQSKITIEDKLGVTIDFFAYPHYEQNQRVRSTVQQAGYRAGLAGWTYMPHTQDHLYRMRRFEITNDTESLIQALK